MGFFKRRDQVERDAFGSPVGAPSVSTPAAPAPPAAAWAGRVTALVIDADAPPEGAPPMGAGSHGTARLLIDPGPHQRVMTTKFRFKADRWLVPGMQVPLAIDAEHPDQSGIDWDAVPSMEDRVAANDPVLADPLGARRRVAEAQGLPAPQTTAFDQALEQARTAPAPEGKLRAVVLVVSVRGQAWDNPDGAGHGVTDERKSAAVLSVNVPGRAPYAVYQRKFKFPHLRRDLTGAGLPALVAAGEPDDVDIQWDELPDIGDQLSARISSSLEQALGATAWMPGSTPAGSQMPGAAAGWQALEAMAPQMMDMVTQNARRALQFVQDPAQRAMLIEQYRAAGIPVDDDPPQPTT
jgi:hypothetical protein